MMWKQGILGSVLVLGCVWIVGAFEDPKPSAERKVDTLRDAAIAPHEEAIRRIVAEATAAFNDHDAKKLSLLFTADAEIVNVAGEVTQGRDAIETAFAAIFDESPQAKMTLNIESLRLIGNSVVIEDGSSRVRHSPDEPDEISRYSVVYTKQDGQWFMASARDLPSDASADEQLKQLAWLVGDWIDENSSGVVATSYRWSENKRFILGDFHLRTRGSRVLDGSVRIGWDPQLKQLRSWVFDSEGGFGTGYWSRSDEHWLVKLSGVTRDGKPFSATNVYTNVSSERTFFESRDRIAGGEVLPDADPVVIVRQPPQPQSASR